MTTEPLIPHSTLHALLAAYRQSDIEICEAFAAILNAQKRLRTAFGGDYSFKIAQHMGKHQLDFAASGIVMSFIKQNAWRELVERMGLRRILSITATQKLDGELEAGKDLPEIEEKTVFAALERIQNRTGEFLNEAVVEVFDYLRPRSFGASSNSVKSVASKVILPSTVEPRHSPGQFWLNPYHQPYLRGVDNVVHALDVPGIAKDERPSLAEAILASTDGGGETPYFKFKCHGNGNLHLQFRRLDLLAKLNEIGRSVPRDASGTPILTRDEPILALVRQATAPTEPDLT